MTRHGPVWPAIVLAKSLAGGLLFRMAWSFSSLGALSVALAYGASKYLLSEVKRDAARANAWHHEIDAQVIGELTA